ncbi:MAG: hypothetical protein KDK55_05330 [Chlamydiia bacterium]|nr:hypothetical protein [Chlamydiia bacterium]
MSGEITSSSRHEAGNYWLYITAAGAAVALISGIALGILLCIYTPWTSSAVLASAGGLSVFVAPGMLCVLGFTTFAIGTVLLVVRGCFHKQEMKENRRQLISLTNAHAEAVHENLFPTNTASSEEDEDFDDKKNHLGDSNPQNANNAEIRDRATSFLPQAPRESKIIPQSNAPLSESTTMFTHEALSDDSQVDTEESSDDLSAKGNEDSEMDDNEKIEKQQGDKSNITTNHLSFESPSSDSEEVTSQISELPVEVNDQKPFARSNSTEDASKLSEDEKDAPKIQIHNASPTSPSFPVSPPVEQHTEEDDNEVVPVATIKKNVNDVILDIFNPVVDEGIILLIRLLKRHPNKIEEKTITEAITHLKNLAINLSNNNYFLLKSALNQLLKFHGTNRNRRKIGAALYLGNEKELKILLRWQDELIQKRQLHGIVDLMHHNIKGALPNLIAKTFSQDNESMIELMRKLISFLCAAFTDEEWDKIEKWTIDDKNWLAKEKELNQTKHSSQRRTDDEIESTFYYTFAYRLQNLLLEVFEREFKKSENDETFERFAAQILENRFLKTGMAKKINGILQMCGKGIGMVEQFLNPSLDYKTIKIPMQRSLYITENADIGNLSEDKKYLELIDLQYHINQGKKSKEHIALFLIPKKTLSENQAKAAKILKETQIEIPLKFQTKIQDLQKKFYSHTIIAATCRQQGGVKELSTLKHINGMAGTINKTIDFFLGSIVFAFVKPLKTKEILMTPADNWIPVLEPQSGWNPAIKVIRKVVGSILENIIEERTDNIAMLNFPGVDDKDLADFHKAIITLIRLLATPAIDALFGDMKNEFRSKTIYKLAIEKGALGVVEKRLFELSNNLEGEIQWDVFAKNAIALIKEMLSLLDEIETKKSGT